MLLRARYSLKDRPCMCRIRARRERSALPCRMSRTEEPVKTAKLQKNPSKEGRKRGKEGLNEGFLGGKGMFCELKCRKNRKISSRKRV